MLKSRYQLFILPLVVFAFAILTCSEATAQDVKYNFMPGTNFAKYKTYSWARVPGAQYPSQIVDAQIRTSIDTQLSSKGLKKVDEGPADLVIAYQISMDQERQWNAMGGGGWRIGMGMGTATSSTINIGTLVVDFYDAAEKQQIWTGSATEQLNPSKDPQKNQKNLDKAMAKLFKNYPPPAK